MIIGIDASNLLQGGGITHLTELLYHSDPQKHGFENIIVWGPEKSLSRIADHPWIKKKSHPLLNKSFFHRTYWKSFLFKQELKQEGCDILFVPGGSDATGFHPMVTMCRNMLPFELNETFRYGMKPITARLIALRLVQAGSFKKADGLIFLTDYARKTVSSIINLNNKTKTATIPHGINERFFIEPRKQRKDFSAENPCRLIYVSILDPYKHHRELLRAVQKLSKDFPLQLDIIGPEGVSAPEVKKIIQDLNNGGKLFINYHGAVPYDSLHEFYSKADIGIFASSCENMPNILLEMMAAGLPIACSNKGPMPEVLSNAGTYFNPESPDEIAHAMATLIDSVELRESLAAKAYEKAKQYSWERCADETFSFLNIVADKIEG